MQDINSQFATSQKVEFLSQRTSYPDTPTQVETLETHMSWVFLTDTYVYKLKKPVRTEVLDFSTLEARYRDCQAELRLNRRLAPQVYLDVVPLTVDVTGQLHLSNGGRDDDANPVDWLVKMYRLPEDSMLNQAIAQGTVEQTEIQQVAALLARFYQNAEPVPLSPQAYCHRIETDLREVLKELTQPEYHFPETWVKEIMNRQLEVLKTDAPLLGDRVHQHHIVEGHGDLRPQHICLRPEVAIIDCLEFNRSLRILDPVDELAFLGLECERLGAPWIEAVLLATYSDITQDQPPPQLIRFYKAYRACLRAKLAVWHIEEPGQNGHNHWRQLARTYLLLGEKYSR
jgi:aminoglycoside phosphotransferase family enzyme